MAGAPQGYIGRNPADGRTTINRQTFNVTTGVQTSFTFTSGYDLGYLEVYLNGIKQSETTDYTAADGSTFSFAVSTPTVQGDTIEAIAYKSFNTTDVTGSVRDFAVGRNLDVTGNVTIGSSLTIASDLVVNGSYTYVNTEILDIEDKTVGIASTSAASNTTADGAGIIVYGGSDGDKSLLWDKDLSNWVLSGGGISLGTGVTISTPATNVLAFSIDGAVNAKLNNYGAFIVGDGVDGEAWGNDYKTVQAGTGAFGGNPPAASAASYWTNNAYYDAVNSRWEYIAADEASRFAQGDGSLAYYNAGSGSADGAITWTERFRVDASGNLSLAGDGNTYIGHPTTDVLAVTTAGSERVRVDASGRLLLGTTASRSIADGTPNLQVEGTAGTASLGLVRNQNNAGGSNLSFAKSRSGSLAGNTIVQDDDTLGNINFAGADGTDINTVAASIVAAVDGTPGANDMPGRLVFNTTADGANSVTERMRIDSAGLVSIPVAGNLQVGGAGSGETDTKVYVANTGGNAYIQVKGADSSGTVGLKFGRNSVANRAGIDWGAATDALIFRTGGTTERLRIDSGGDVGINTTSILTRLEVFEATGTKSTSALVRFRKNHTSTSVTGSTGAVDQFPHALILENSDNSANTGAVSLSFSKHTSGNQSQAIIAGLSESAGNMALTFNTESSNSIGERLRITASGLVLIGGTDTNYYSANLVLTCGANAGGFTIRSNSTSDSNFITFADAASSPGYLAGGLKYSHSDDTLTLRAAANEKVHVKNGGLDPAADDALDLGNSSARWRDLYLSSGVFLGGTGSANELTDYEEGTWTPTLHDASGNSSTFGGVTEANYTKIGNTVRLTLRAVNMATSGMTGGDAVYLKGLPFTTQGYNYAWCFVRNPDTATDWGPATNDLFSYCNTNQITFAGSNGTGGTTFTWADVINNTTDLFLTTIYKTGQ